MATGVARAAATGEAAQQDTTAVGLRYVSSDDPGIARRRRGARFIYLQPSGDRVTDPVTLDRIRKLVVPPAWTDVWICPLANGYLQATGRDARGRKQYRYHARFRVRRDVDKFARIIRFGQRLPRIRRRVSRDLRARGLPREKVTAAMVRLLELTLLRVGNEEYVRLNKSFGLSTLRSRHARIRGQTVLFRCRGKAGRVREVGVTDRRLAAIIRRCQDLPGQRLFEYLDPDGGTHEVDSEAVNEYLRRAAGDDSFSAKDFRTWTATVLAFRALQAAERPMSAADAKRTVVSAIRETADRLGNTPAVARLSYVHPAVLDAYLATGGVPATFASPRRAVPSLAPPTPAEEAALLDLLRAKARQDTRQARCRGGPLRAAGSRVGGEVDRASASRSRSR
jgi:Topoisomerase IB